MLDHAIGINTAIAITGLSKRTLWRRIAEGLCRKSPDSDEARTLLILSDVLTLTKLVFDTEERRLLAAADANDRAAQTEIGQIFAQADRYGTAAYWFKRAAALGHADAMQCLGQCYAAGQGVTQDKNLALMWIAKAAAHGHVIARLQMSQLQTQGNADQFVTPAQAGIQHLAFHGMETGSDST